jgi:type II secretory pathway pseudopilin PulG
MPQHLSRGFALIEALVAALLVATAVAGLTHLVTLGLAQSSRTRQSTVALTLAQAKLEELRALAWLFDFDGARVSSAELSTSPPATLTQNVDGWFEQLDRSGASGAPDDVTHYWRRWAIAPADAADDDTLRLQVCVCTSVRPGGATDACVWALRTRKP